MWNPPSRLNAACETRLLVIPEGLWLSVLEHVIHVAIIVTALITGHQDKTEEGRGRTYSFKVYRGLELQGSQGCPSLSYALEGRRSSGGGPLLTVPGIAQ